VSYDPRDHGARCASCWLYSRREGGPVPMERNETDRVIVGEAPGKDEVSVGRPFVGRSGDELMTSLAVHGARRRDFSYTNALLCVHGNTLVWTEEGKDARISDLVISRFSGRVWSLNNSGELVLAPVVGWHSSARGDREMVKLTSEYIRKGSRGTTGPTLTIDHPVLTASRGWIPVGKLHVGERVVTADRKADDAGTGIVIGSLLGDGTISKSNRFAVCQMEENADYVGHKARALSPFGGKITHVHTPKMEAAGIKPRVDLCFPASRWFRELRKRFYPSGVKVVPRDIVLNDVALAVWFLDDGDLRLRDSRLQRGSIATCGFEKDDVEWLTFQLRSRGIEDAHAVWHSHWGVGNAQKMGYWRIALGPIGIERLATRIARFVPPSMQYKLPLFHRGHFDARVWDPVATTAYVDASAVEPSTAPPVETVYCLDVDGTHNFVTCGGFVVHNCRPPGNELAKMEYALGRENKRRKKLNKDLPPGEQYALLPHPVDCCRPRILKELQGFSKIITVGDTAFRDVTGMEHSISKMRGSCLEGWIDDDGYVSCDTSTPETRRASEMLRAPGATEVKVLPTFHPSLILRQRKWTSVFRGDIGRALRWFNGQRGWVEPIVVTRPTVAQLAAFLARKERFFAWDLETNDKEALVAKIRCFGVGTTERVMVVPLRSKDSIYDYYTDEDRAQILNLLRTFLGDKTIMKAGWNSGLYDRTVAEQELGVTPRKNFDGILAHHDVESEMPHRLGFVGTTMTDVVAWKQDSEDILNVDDETLWRRNALDVVVTARLVEPLEQGLVLKDQVAVCRNDHKLQQVCHGMHRNGMLVDYAARDAHDKRLLKEILHYRKVARDCVGNPDHNPTSFMQVAEVLFEKWDLPPVKLSDQTGAPSTDDDALRDYRVNFNLTDVQKKYIEAVRKIRRGVKYRGTNILKLRKRTERVIPDEFAIDLAEAEETEEEREYRFKKDRKKTGILLADGRIHSSWNPHVATSGRLSSSDPAMQNWDRKLRNMIVAAPGNLLVGADSDQLELRFAAGHWNMQKMIAVFREGRDPHHETAMAIFGRAASEMLTRAEAWAKEQPLKDGKKVKAKSHAAYGKMRDFAKRFRYAVQYKAMDKTVHRVISSVEDEDGNLIYADVSLTDCSNRRRALLDADPEYEIGWENEIQTWRRQGYLRDRIWGRRREFLNGEPDSDDVDVENEIVNFPIQCGGAHIIHDATFDMLEEIPFEKWGPGTGLIHQGHDALVVECPEKEAKRVAEILVKCMTRTYPGLDVQFKSEGKIGKRWSEV